MNNDTIVVLDGARTPIGSFGGMFKDVPAFELGATAAVEALSRAKVDPADIREVVMGCIGQVGPDAYNARRVAVRAGLSTSVPAYTVNRLCGSGLQAVWSAAMEMRWNDLDFVLAGGDESMTRMPFYDFGARRGYKLGQPGPRRRHRHDADRPVPRHPNGRDRRERRREVRRLPPGAGRVRRRVAASSGHVRGSRRVRGRDRGSRGRRPTPTTADTDEHPKPGTTVEALAALRPAFSKDGTVTAGNASGINDGAAVLVLARKEAAAAQGLTGLVSLEAVTTAAMEPELMGYAPTLALESLFTQTKMSPSDIGIIELNEAFASQAVAVIRDAGLDLASVNPYGGAIALGHPVGATGANLTLRVAKDMVRRDLEFGIVTMCIGGGQAMAALFRRV